MIVWFIITLSVNVIVPVGFWSTDWISILKVISWVIDVIEESVDAVTTNVERPL